MGRQIRSRQVARALPVLLPALLGAGGEAPSQSPDSSLEAPGKGLIASLGSENWDERESAQLRLLEEGLSVAPLLEQAIRSENLELAYRARYLLARIDPRITAFQVIRLGTGSRVEVIDAAVAAGMEGEELSTRPIAGDVDAVDYTIQFRTEGTRSAEADSDEGARLPAGAGRLEIWISKARQGSPAPEARCQISPTAAIALVQRGEECLYTRMGLEIARERRAYITILRVKTGRKSLLEKEPFSSGKEAIFDEVVRELDAQSLARDPEDRSAAIEILGDLGRYRGSLEEHLADPDTRDAAAYASDKPELLEDLLQRAARDADAPPGRGSILAVRSAAKLAARGSPEAAAFLLEKLLDPEPPHPHLLLASLADAIREGKLPRQTRLEVERRALTDETLTRVPWDDVESEYFFSALIAALDPEIEEDRELARAFLSSLERLARGELGPVAVRLRTIIELWRRAARKASANAAESRMLLGILPHLNGAASFSEAAVILEDALMREAARGESDADLLGEFLAVLTGNIAEGDPGVINVSFQSLLRLSRVFPGGRGQLAPLAGALMGACEAAYREPGAAPRGTQRSVSPAAHLLRQAEEILAGWTGIPAPPGQPGTRKPDTSAWRSWLDDASRVEAREAELLAARSSSAEEAASRFVYYEFDLATGDPKKGQPRARVLDARRLEVRLSQPILYRDRWGNEVQIRIDPEPRNDANPTRFRVSSRPMLFAGLPALTSVQGRDLSATWHDSSDLTTSSTTPIPGADAPGFRSLVLLLPAGEDPEAPAGAPPDELWPWFLEHRLLVLPENATPQKVQAVINVVRQLEPRQAAPLVRRLFDKTPTLDFARLLYELGDEAGVPVLLAELAKGGESRVGGSILLLELGHAAGLDGLQGADAPRQANRKMSVANALDVYLRHPRATPEGKEKALGLLFDRLDDDAYQQKAFQVIQRETGLDFGYASARGIDDQDRRAAALKDCVRSAKDWWQARTGTRERGLPGTRERGLRPAK